MVDFCHTYVPLMLVPLYAPLHQGTEWRWSQKEQDRLEEQGSIPAPFFKIILV